MESGTDFESDLTDVDSNTKKITLKADALKRHKCPFENCGSAFNRPWKLVRHFNTHTKQRPFKCDFPGCSKDYMNNSHLQRHKSVSHGKPKALTIYLICPFPDCKKAFSNKYSLKKHSNKHKKINVYSCKLCNSEFKKNWQLKQHLFIHSGLKSFSCNVCNESLETKRELKAHERLHNPYRCEEEGCSEKFFTLNALRNHTKITHPQRFECDFCGNTFVNKWTLTEHVLSHLPNDCREVLVCPYKDCGRHYFHKRNLNHHIKSFHENINYMCEVCENTFVNKSKLRDHHLKYHAQPAKGKTDLLEIKKTVKKTERKPRQDKGKPKKSIAAFLSGIDLPYQIEKSLNQNNIKEEILQYMENLKKNV